MARDRRRSAVFVSSPPGQASVASLVAAAEAGERPRKDYVELARALDADVVDLDYMLHRATRPARVVARRASPALGQVVEGFLASRRLDRIVVWSDQVALPLALLLKLGRRRRELVVIVTLISDRKKAAFFRYFRVHSHLGAIVARRAQVDFAAEQLGVPREKLHVEVPAVDERFWSPAARAPDDVIASVGFEERDYGTLIESVRGLDVEAELAIGAATVSAAAARERVALVTEEAGREGLPPNVRCTTPELKELRDLYARSRFVVIPARPVEYDVGSTVATEAMAMGKAIVATGNEALRGVFEDGVHGLFVPPEDPRAMRGAIERLLAKPEEAEAMGRAGRALVEERYGLDRFVGRMVDIVEAAAPRR